MDILDILPARANQNYILSLSAQLQRSENNLDNEMDEDDEAANQLIREAMEARLKHETHNIPSPTWAPTPKPAMEHK